MKSLLNLMILATLTKENKYGLQIIKDIKNISTLDIDLKLPSLYNSIKRLENYGYLECYWENSAIGGKRRYCSLTEKGKDYINTQMELLSIEDKNEISKLIENNVNQQNYNNIVGNEEINVLKNEEENESISIKNNEIAIQPTFLNQCLENDKENNENNSSEIKNLNTEEQYINDNQESFNFKDIFGDIVYSDIDIQKKNEAKQKLFKESSDSINLNEEIINDGIITEKQNIEDNYKVNVTLKSINKKDNETSNDKINKCKDDKNIVLENIKNNNTENEIPQQNIINPNNEDKLLSKYNKIQEEMLCTNAPQETNSINECLKYFSEIGITYKICNNKILPKKDFEFNSKEKIKFYKNKFKAKQVCLNSFICSLVLLISYISLDLFDLLKTSQKIIFLCLAIIMIIYSIIAIFNLINNFNKISNYKPPIKKNLLLVLYVSLITILVIVAFCFFFGMTPINYNTYLAYVLCPALLTTFIYSYYLIGKIMAKNNKFFIK